MNIPALNTLTPPTVFAPRSTATENAGVRPDAQAKLTPNRSEQTVQTAEEMPASQQAVDQAVQAINDFVSQVNSSLNFSVDQDSGQTVVKVIDVATKEVIKQFPSEEMLALAKALDSIKGLLLQQRA